MTMEAAFMFAQAQASYAEHGIATFPVTKDKTPAIRGFVRVGLVGSAMLARKFANADAIGFMCGQRNRITVLDIDTDDERVLADALTRHGQTPLVVRTGSGHFQVYYRHNGERRRIRPWRGLPIDVLGGGMAIAPPSRVTKGNYSIIRGRLDDLDRLPAARDLASPREVSGLPDVTRDVIDEGDRNNTLWRHCMKNAKACDDYDALLDVASSFNANCVPPLEDTEVHKITQSAWEYTERGHNRFGEFGAWFPVEEVMTLVTTDLDAFALLGFLRAHNGPWATFMCTNTVAETLGWRRQRMGEARTRLIELGYIVKVRSAGYRTPALFQWAARSKVRAEQGRC
jgi:Bifunctional DNA primase/polymerase, N-terminal/Primase C terminal 1 (PriCT-1)